MLKLFSGKLLNLYLSANIAFAVEIMIAFAFFSLSLDETDQKITLQT